MKYIFLLCLFIVGCKSLPPSPITAKVTKKAIINPCDNVDDTLLGITWPCYHWTNFCDHSSYDQCIKPLPNVTIIWDMIGRKAYVQGSTNGKTWYPIAETAFNMITISNTKPYELFRVGY